MVILSEMAVFTIFIICSGAALIGLFDAALELKLCFYVRKLSLYLWRRSGQRKRLWSAKCPNLQQRMKVPMRFFCFGVCAELLARCQARRGELNENNFHRLDVQNQQLSSKRLKIGFSLLRNERHERCHCSRLPKQSDRGKRECNLIPKRKTYLNATLTIHDLHRKVLGCSV